MFPATTLRLLRIGAGAGYYHFICMIRIATYCCMALIATTVQRVYAEPVSAAVVEARCIIVEAYVRRGERSSSDVVGRIKAITQSRDGLILVVRDILDSA